MTNQSLSFKDNYQQLSFTDFTRQYEKIIPKARLFELSLPWLAATAKFMLEASDNLVIHCLFNTNNDLLIAWPLVHQCKNKQIRSLSSFYSAVTEPIYLTQASTKEKEHNIEQLLCFIEWSITQKGSHWQSMQLGSFELNSVVSNTIVKHFPRYKVFAQTDNIYQSVVGGFEQYYQQRPSQLRNTIKRRSKKLVEAHKYRTQIVTTLIDFPSAFEQYKIIYQQSWKGEEYSFDFIEQVCLAALSENKLRLGLLYIDDEAVAAQIWFIQTCLVEETQSREGETQSSQSQKDQPISKQLEEKQTENNVSIFKLAYKPAYQQFSVGSLLSMALSEYVINRDKATSIEFGMGSEPYKHDWLTDKKQRVTYQVFNHQCFYGKLATIRYITLPNLVKKLSTGRLKQHE